MNNFFQIAYEINTTEAQQAKDAVPFRRQVRQEQYKIVVENILTVKDLKERLGKQHGFDPSNVDLAVGYKILQDGMVLNYILFNRTTSPKVEFFSKGQAPRNQYQNYFPTDYTRDVAYWDNAHSEVGSKILAHLKKHKTYLNGWSIVLRGEEAQIKAEKEKLKGNQMLLAIGAISPEDIAEKETELDAREKQSAEVKPHWDKYSQFCSDRLLPFIENRFHLLSIDNEVHLRLVEQLLQDAYKLTISEITELYNDILPQVSAGVMMADLIELSKKINGLANPSTLSSRDAFFNTRFSQTPTNYEPTLGAGGQEEEPASRKQL